MAQAIRAVPTVTSSPAPASTPVWPIPGDAPDLETIIGDQADTIAAQAALIDAYQGVLNAAQNPPPGTPATGTGTTAGSSTSLSVNAVTGIIIVGATVTDIPVPPAASLIPTGTIVLGQISGTPGMAGSYLLNNAVNIPSTGDALTFTPPPPKTTWPTPTDSPTLMLIQQTQVAVIRMQSSLLQNYQELLNLSQTTPPATGP